MPVRRGSGAANAWPEAIQDIGALAFECDGRRRTIDEFLASSYTDGFLVLHRGRLVVERYGNSMTRNTNHLLQSVSKSVTGALAGILVGRGELRTQAPLTHYLPQLANTAYRGATVQHVLDMTSGVAWDENYTALDSHMAQLDAACGWKERRDPCWPECTWDLVLTLHERAGEHGSIFSYRSIETDVLGFVLEKVSGARIPELLSRELWAPMGAEEAACFTVDPAGFACTCGGFNATLRDVARFAQLLVTQGVAADGRRVLPAQWIAETRRGNHQLFQGSYRQVLPDGAYQNQFWIEDAGRCALIGRGVFGQLVYVDPEAEYVAVKLSSWPEFTGVGRLRESLAAVRAVRDVLG